MRRWLSTLVACAAVPAFAASEITIELLPQARVPAGPVVLGQVAHLRTTDLDLMRVLVNLPIGRAPAAGESAVLERGGLSDWVRQRARLAETQVHWSGAGTVRVTGASRSLAGDDIAAAAADHLRAWLATQAGHSAIELERLPRDIDVPDATVRLHARPLARAQLRKRMLVWVDVWAAQRYVRTVPVAFSVSAWREVATTSEPLSAGANLGRETVSLREIDVAGMAGVPLLPGVPAGPLETRRPLRAGEAIRQQDVQPAAAVLRGQWASLRSSAGAVSLETRVEVLQDGRPGDSVRVRQPGATAGVVAKVVGPGQLEVAR